MDCVSSSAQDGEPQQRNASYSLEAGEPLLQQPEALDRLPIGQDHQVGMHVVGRRVTRAGLGTARLEDDLVQFEESVLLGQLVQQSGQLWKVVAVFSSAGRSEE